MPLSSNRRQDYEHSRWQLGQSLGRFLEISPEHGTRAVIDAVIGRAATKGYGEPDEPAVIDLGTTKVEFRGHDAEFNAWEEEDDDLPGGDDDLLKNFVAFLRGCDAEAFSASVAAASRDYATASVWSRILGVASERVGEVGDLVWPLTERPDLIENSDTLRDAVRFVVAAWPSRAQKEKVRVERMWLDDTRHPDEERKKRWRRILGRLLALIPEEELALDATRDLRRQMQAHGELQENRPIRNFGFSWRDHGDWQMEQLCREGVDMDAGPNRMVFDAANALDAKFTATPGDSEATALAALWSDTMAMIVVVDDSPELHARVDRSAWGHISNAVERVASSLNYAPGVDDLPDLDTMFAVLDRLSSSKYPEPPETER